MRTLSKKNKGFTLVELLVVILIISILSGLLIKSINSGGMRAKSRDGQRMGDINKIRTALEDYYYDYRTYPASGAGWIVISGSDALSNILLAEGYILDMPVDPVGEGLSGVSGPCDATTPDYFYRFASGTYHIVALMEVPSSAEDSPCVNVGITCSPARNDCYGVKNP